MSVSLKHTSDVDGDRGIDRNTVNPYLIERGRDIDHDIAHHTANPALVGRRTDAWFSWPWSKKDRGHSLNGHLDALKSARAVHRELNRQQKELKRQTDLADDQLQRFWR